MINWLKIIIFFIGGLALFLYGMEIMSDGLVKASGSRIRKILNTFTKNRFAAFLTGALSTTVIQSSSAVSVITISLVEANLIKFKQTFGILLGAGIGTTITAQIIAFKISEYSLLIIAIGFFIRIISSKELMKLVGSSILGFGLLFYGLDLMSDAMVPLRTNEKFIDTILYLENPLLGIFVGFLLTALIQSSSAFIGILIVLATQGLLSLEAAVPLLLGSNIGTTTTAFLASINSGIEARRIAFAFFLINLAGVFIVIGWIPSYTMLIEVFSDSISIKNAAHKANLPRQIANAHTLFNFGVSVLLLPFSNSITNWIITVMPTPKKVKEKPVQIKYLKKKLIDQPSLALSLAKKETIEMGMQVKLMLEAIIVPFTEKKQGNIDKMHEHETAVDYYQNKIVKYVTKVSQGNLNDDLANESFKILFVVSELEVIADIVNNSLLEKALIWLTSTKDFSDEGKKELKLYHNQILELYMDALLVFSAYDANSISKLKKKNKMLRHLSIELKQKHFSRLSKNIPESIATSERHREIIENLRTIQSHIANIMRLLY